MHSRDIRSKDGNTMEFADRQYRTFHLAHCFLFSPLSRYFVKNTFEHIAQRCSIAFFPLLSFLVSDYAIRYVMTKTQK